MKASSRGRICLEVTQQGFIVVSTTQVFRILLRFLGFSGSKRQNQLFTILASFNIAETFSEHCKCRTTSTSDPCLNSKSDLSTSMPAALILIPWYLDLFEGVLLVRTHSLTDRSRRHKLQICRTRAGLLCYELAKVVITFRSLMWTVYVAGFDLIARVRRYNCLNIEKRVLVEPD